MFYDFSDIFVTFDWVCDLDLGLDVSEHGGLTRLLDHSVHWLGLRLKAKLLLRDVLHLSLWHLDGSLHFIASLNVLRDLSVLTNFDALVVEDGHLSIELDWDAVALNWHFHPLLVGLWADVAADRFRNVNLDWDADLVPINLLLLLEDIGSALGFAHISADLFHHVDLLGLADLIGDLFVLDHLNHALRHLDLLLHLMYDFFVARLLVTNLHNVDLLARDFHAHGSILRDFGHEADLLAWLSNLCLDWDASLFEHLSGDLDLYDILDWLVDDSLNVDNLLLVDGLFNHALLDKSLAVEVHWRIAGVARILDDNAGWTAWVTLLLRIKNHPSTWGS